MAITVQAPLAAQLYSLGSASDVGGKDVQFKGNVSARPQGFDTGQRAMPAPAKDRSGERSKALGSIASTAIGAYLGSQSGSAPVSEAGNGYGLGGNLVSGTVDNPEYAGTQQATLFSPSTQSNMPADNGYRDSNPYALDYSNGRQRSSLFNYSGSYGGATY
jgi:hypothetical protein